MAKKKPRTNRAKNIRGKQAPELPAASPPALRILETVASSKWTPVILCAFFVANGLFAALANSGVCDELGAHIPSGYLYWTTGQFGGGLDNPPLGQLLIASLVKLFGLTYDLFSEQHLVLFRLPVLAVGLLLGIFLYKLAVRLFDKKVAAIALFFYCLSPNILAHASLATLDIPVAFFIFLSVYFSFSVIKNPNLMSWLGLCLAVSLALTTKIQAVLLLPLLAVLFAAQAKDLRTNAKVNAKSVLLGLLLFVLIALVTINLAYLHLPLAHGNPLLPQAFTASIEQKILHGEEGHFAYLLGRYSEKGWWYYFPLTILFKTPLAVLLFLGLGLGRKPTRKIVWFLLLPSAVFLAAAMRSHVNIGIRHILIIYPFLFIVASLGTLRILNWNPGTGAKTAVVHSLVGLLLLSHLAQAAVITPHQLSFFNILAGGSKNGHKILIDSNYDWGQNDRVLERYVRSQNVHYKIDPDAFTPGAGRILVNANALYGVLNSGPDAYRWLKNYKPVHQIAYTWFEYFVPDTDLPKLAGFKRDLRNSRPPVDKAQLESTQHKYADDADPQPHMQLAVLFINALDYRGAFREIRTILKNHPTDAGALALGGELIVRLKLGALLFKGDDDYLEFFKSNI